MSIRQLKDVTNIPTERLDDWGTPMTIGEPLCHLNGIQLIENADGLVAAEQCNRDTREANEVRVEVADVGAEAPARDLEPAGEPGEGSSDTHGEEVVAVYRYAGISSGLRVEPDGLDLEAKCCPIKQQKVYDKA